MGEVITLRKSPINIDSDVGHQFVTDCTRAAEGLMTDRELADKYELSSTDWEHITKSTALGHAVRSERERRVKDGTAVREMAAKHLVKGPGILDQIMTSPQANSRHRIEAFKELRTTAIGGTDKLPESARFIISIDLGAGHVEHYDVPRKPMKIDASDGDGTDKLLEGKPDDDE